MIFCYILSGQQKETPQVRGKKPMQLPLRTGFAFTETTEKYRIVPPNRIGLPAGCRARTG